MLALPVLGLKTGMPSIKVVPESDSSRIGYTQVQAAFGPGAPGTLQVVAPAAEQDAVEATLASDPGIAAVTPRGCAPAAPCSFRPSRSRIPSDAAVGATIDRLRTALPAGALVGGAVAENHDLESALAAKTPLVIGVVLVLGFLLLLVALQAPLIAAVGVAHEPARRPRAAFGVAKLIFQDGHGAGLLGFESQGFLDAWGPVFFFAMIFAISMDYTVFLLVVREGALGPLAATRSEAMVGGVAHSGRVIFAAGGGDGRGLLHVRPLRAAAAEGDGRHPRRRGAARRAADPARADARAAAPARHLRPGRCRAGSTACSPTSASGTRRDGRGTALGHRLSRLAGLVGQPRAAPALEGVEHRGAERTRTAVRGFAGLCLTTRPRRRSDPS